MKTNKIIKILIGLILITLVIDGILIWKNKTVEHKIINNQKDDNTIKYHCYTKNFKEEKLKNINYQTKEEYDFTVQNNEITTGNYKEILHFTNDEDYKWFKENIKQEFEVVLNENDKEIYYKAAILLKEEGQHTNIFTDKYIEYLNRSGFTCEEVKQ